MKDRIAKILREEGMTAAKFAEEIGVQASGISHILSGRNNPSTDFLVKILERFRGINSEWLLLGKGNMYKSGLNSTINEAGQVTHDKIGTDLFSAAQNNSKLESSIKHEPESLIESEEEIDLSNIHDNSDIHISTGKTPITSQEYEKQTSERKVEKIVIFFNDNSFEAYNPHQK